MVRDGSEERPRRDGTVRKMGELRWIHALCFYFIACLLAIAWRLQDQAPSLNMESIKRPEEFGKKGSNDMVVRLNQGVIGSDGWEPGLNACHAASSYDLARPAHTKSGIIKGGGGKEITEMKK